MDDATRATTDALIELIRTRIVEALGDDLLGLYLTGSLATGDFDTDVSDVDLVAVTAKQMTPVQLERLGAVHAGLAAEQPTWDNRIEVVYISRGALTTFRTERMDLAVTSPGEPFHTKDAGIDWLINWYVVREMGVTLHGPTPDAFIAPISREEFVQAVVDSAAWWRDRPLPSGHRNFQVYATLTLCRALYSFHHGAMASKRASALWAAERMPEWAPLIRAALEAWRRDWYNPSVDHDATLADTIRFVRDVAARIAPIGPG